MNHIPDFISEKACLVAVEELSHYRIGVYRRLEEDVHWKFTFAGGNTDTARAIPTIPDGSLRDQRGLKNRNLPGGLIWQSGLLRICLREKFHTAILIGNANIITIWLATGLLRLRGTKVYFWTTGWHRPESGVKLLCRKLFYGISHGLLLYGIDGFELAIQAGLRASRLHIIGNSHDMAEQALSSVSSTLPACGSKPTVGAVVRLQYVKRLDLLLEAVHILDQRGLGPIDILFVGEGPAKDALQEQAAELGLSVSFAGSIYDPIEIAKVYQDLWLTVVPELAGLTTIQSLAHGVPVLTVDDPYSQAPEFRAVVPGVTGDLYPKGDVDILATKIALWFESLRRDRTVVAELCRKEVARNWTPSIHAKRILSVISQNP